MPTFREFLRIAEMTTKDKTSGKRMKEIYGIVKKHDAFKGLTPEKAVSILEDLGPTFVKIGQIASNRADILPREYCDAFEQLRAHVPPLSFDVVIETIERNFQGSWTEVFASIEETPLGSASIAQVHKARLLDGTVVAIKVRRPGIVPKMAEDIMLMKHLLSIAEFTSSAHEGALFSFENLVSELERTTANEVDFSIELNNLVRFHDNLKYSQGISSPLPYPQYSSEEVLVMEYVTGILFDQTEALKASGADLASIGKRLAENYVDQVINRGFFHADPHPGNILLNQNTIIWVDLGMTGSLTSSERALIGRIFLALASEDSFDLKESLLALTKTGEEVDHGRLLEQLDAMLSAYMSADLSEINVGTAFLDVIDILRTHNLTLPASLTMLARGFLTIEGVIKELSPRISIVDIISKQVRKSLFDPEHLVAKGKEFALSSAHSVEAAAKLPTQVSNTLSMLNRGEINIGAELKATDSLLSSIYTVSGRLALALISAGLFVGSSVLCTTNMQPQLLDVPLLGFFGYLGAFVLGVYVIWETLAARHEERNHKKIK